MIQHHQYLSTIINLISRPLASELGGLGVGNCRRRSEKGRVVNPFADARGSRAKGRIIRQLIKLCEYGFKFTIKLRIRTEQRAERIKHFFNNWRAAKYPLRDGLSNVKEQYYGTDPSDRDSDDDGVLDSVEVFWNVDTDGDGKINSLDPDSDNDGNRDSFKCDPNDRGYRYNV